MRISFSYNFRLNVLCGLLVSFGEFGVALLRSIVLPLFPRAPFVLYADAFGEIVRVSITIKNKLWCTNQSWFVNLTS